MNDDDIYYDRKSIDNIRTDYLYKKTFTSIVKQIKKDLNIDENEYQNLCSPYFEENKLLLVELDQSIKDEIMKYCYELSTNGMFQHYIRDYCEKASSLQIKKSIISRAIVNNKNNDLNDSIDEVYKNLSDEEIRSIAYDVIYSSYVVN